MDTEQSDAVDHGIGEQLCGNFSSHVSLDNPVVPAAEQEGELAVETCQGNEHEIGDCHIFNFQEFERKFSSFERENDFRKGSKKDIDRLEYDFTALGFDVIVHNNLSYEQTFLALTKAGRKDHSKKKYFICCFLTHGGEEDVLWAKDRAMKKDDILKIFSDSPSLIGKPKVFIIQACRGQIGESPVWMDSVDGCCEETLLIDSEVYLDFLIVNSSYPGFYSFRDCGGKSRESHGSFFIDEFCRSLEQFSTTLELLKILTLVNFRMANTFLSHHEKIKERDGKKQMPCFTSTLRQAIKFDKLIEPLENKHTDYFNDRRRRHGSGEAPLSDINRYDTNEPKKILCLSVLYENTGEAQSAIKSLAQFFHLRNYSCEDFTGNFVKSEVFEFLDQNSSYESQTEASSGLDCLICYVAAYSRYDYLCDAKGEKITKQEIVEKYIGQQKNLFIGKPKIFIFLLRKLQANEDFPKEKFDENMKPAIKYNLKKETTGNNKSFEDACYKFTDGKYIGENLIPIHADILEISITVTDWKHAVGPMNSFCKVLEKRSDDKVLDLHSLLTELNCELVERHNFFQMTKNSFSFTSTLTKFLYLPLSIAS